MSKPSPEHRERCTWLCATGRVAVLLSLAALLLVIGTSSAALAQSRPIEEDLARYWSGTREMPVIAGEKLYNTSERFEIGVFGGILPNDAFYTYFPVGLSGAFHFSDIWAVELAASFVDLKMDSALTDFLIDRGASIRKEVDLGDQQVFRTDAIAMFSPLYGKWSFQTYKISHFDLFFMLGAGVVVVKEPETPDGARDPNPEPVTTANVEGLLGAGFRFFVADWATIRLNAKWYLYYRGFDESLAAPAEITLGVSFLTPAL